MATRQNRDTPHRYRSGEAARLARMPAATLRIWERRYGVVAPPKTPSGQRMYSEDDVQRIRLLKALVNQGHAIGTIANLSREELEALSLADARSPAPAEMGGKSRRLWRASDFGIRCSANGNSDRSARHDRQRERACDYICGRADRDDHITSRRCCLAADYPGAKAECAGRRRRVRLWHRGGGRAGTAIGVQLVPVHGRTLRYRRRPIIGVSVTELL
ncbi:HTH-type transcriptional repressor CarH [Burkholderia multivorans]|uniref:MerR family transcriptional regulator n=1 Tax=Burkholderia pseudomultivorans TaxID=1207504 RepID=A0A6P2K1G3_9BURK|nr:merR regulatory family protein [Burkholderia multivorans]VWB48245.1 MerR family transcriptional regulator [Burkholderia pseudomultivorans]MDR8783169.1 HTH-type transcriptional repressor CarH [Burkholderia multivorans]MDR8826972.1 HTH-type transcriptional repressor CarH [Burkholderia multivorans]MDR8872633.1 HTH-type transcriptional repressor CarH [Burkholderia multivorans]